MTLDVEGLHRIANTTRPDRRADIVFVHGLGGASHSTWRHGKLEKPGHFFWPEALGEDLPDCGIWTLGHASGMTHWFSDEGMALEDLANNFALKLANNDFGERPIVFIVHSMGGLVVKELVTAAGALGGENWDRVVKVTRGIVFLGTPHHGAHMATVAKGFAALLRTQEHLKQMEFAARALDQLHKRFMKWQAGTQCAVESYVETRGIARSGWFGLKRLLPSILVVSDISGDPKLTGCDCHRIGADHIALVKPPNREHDVYAGVLRFIRNTLGESPPKNPNGSENVRLPGNPKTDLSRILKYAPAELIGREAETQLIDAAWAKVQGGEPNRPRVLTFVALGGEGKTSLVAHWAAALCAQNWPGCDAAFAWSFYSQGTRDQSAASSDVFLKEALAFFGDDEDREFAASSAGAFEKGQRLARIVGERKNLLILDGLEPLQYAPTSPTPGELRDQGLVALLKGLAQHNRGLCLVTTRYSLPDLNAFRQTTAPEVKLQRLSRAAGVDLLKKLGVCGAAREFETLVEDVKGHALTLTLLGSYLHDAHDGDIRRRDMVKLEEADAEEQGGHAFRVMAAYELAFEWEGDKGQRALALLRLLGLFDRPMTADCFDALLQTPPLTGLTELLVDATPPQRRLALTRLENAKLLAVGRDAAGTLRTVDAHPLLRDYFAQQLRKTNAAAWRAAHRRLYEHLCASTLDRDAPTLEDLQPLYQAVAHGCLAGMQQAACDEVYIARILRREEQYSIKKLGAFGSDLGTVACFFEQPWRRVSPALSEPDQAWLLNEAAFRLRALSRLTEALEPMRATMKINIAKQKWKNAAVCASTSPDLD